MKKLLVLTVLGTMALTAASHAADAKAYWDKQCAKCHGAEGKGDTKMGKKLEVKDYSDAKVQANLKDDEMIKAIKEGKKDGDKTKMKAYTDLNDTDMKALIAHVRSFKK